MGKENEKSEKGIGRIGLKDQYFERLETLRLFGFIGKNGEAKAGGDPAPSFERVIRVFTPEMLEFADSFKRPTLLLVPKTSFGAKVRAIDTHKAMEDQKDTHLNVVFRRSDSNSESIDGWEAFIVEGSYDVGLKPDDDPEGALIDRIATRKGNRVRAKDGSVLERGMDCHAYAMLMMEALRRGRPIDVDGWTLLDDDPSLSDTRMPGANWVAYDHQVAFHADHEYLRRAEARFRSSVGGEVG